MTQKCLRKNEKQINSSALKILAQYKTIT